MGEPKLAGVPPMGGSGNETGLSEDGRFLIVGSRRHSIPLGLDRKKIVRVVDALAFYGREGNHQSAEGRIPAVWADTGRRAREVLASFGAIDDVAELEEEE